MTAANPVASRSPDRTAVCGASRSAPSQCERVTGPGFSSPNQPDQERTTAYRDSSGPDSRSDAHCATIFGDWEEPSGESPFNAIDYCLSAGGITLKGVDHIVYAMDPWILMKDWSPAPKFELSGAPTVRDSNSGYNAWQTIFIHGVASAPRLQLQDVPWHFMPRFDVESGDHHWDFRFVEHHTAHAASTFLPSPFERAAILSLDGAGEKVTTLMGYGEGTQIETLQVVEIPHSFGKLYKMVTWYLGFLNSSDEYKIIALA